MGHDRAVKLMCDLTSRFNFFLIGRGSFSDTKGFTVGCHKPLLTHQPFKQPQKSYF